MLRLASLAAQAGVRFRYELAVEALAEEGGRVVGAQLKHADGRIEHFAADATVVCLGSYSARLLPPALLPQPVYPVKGYSITVPVSDPQRAPSVSLTEESRRIVCSRLGARLRVAGTAELAGYDLQPNAVRSAALLDWLDRHFPAAADLAAAEHWCGLRPATPSNVPLIGRSARAGLWLNTGHGTLGWTLACGSADNLARLMSGTSPLADFPFLGAGEA